MLVRSFFALSELISHTSSFRMINVCVVDVNGSTYHITMYTILISRATTFVDRAFRFGFYILNYLVCESVCKVKEAKSERVSE